MSNISIIGIPEGEKRKKGTESLFKQRISENYSNLWKELEPQIPEANRTFISIYKDLLSPRHIRLKLSEINDNERILKATGEKETVTY